MYKNIRIKIALILYSFFTFFILYNNPKQFYNDDRELLPFGLGENKTILPLWLVILIFAFLSYYLSCILIKIL